VRGEKRPGSPSTWGGGGVARGKLEGVAPYR
jgi:hypothetical protein